MFSKKTNDIILYISVGINIVLIITVIFLGIKKQKDGFCTCSGLQTKLCNNPEELKRLYREGKLTEYNFPTKQNDWNDPLNYSSRQCNQKVPRS